MDSFKQFGEIALGSRLKRLSDYMMKETQLVYNNYNIDFDPYLFPVFKIINSKKGVINTEITESLQVTQPAITQAINKLIAKKLILLKSHKTDKRKKTIHLSKKGEQFTKDTSLLWECIEKVLKKTTTNTCNSLVEHLSVIENRFQQKSFSKLIIETFEMEKQKTLKIVNFKPEYAANFYELNIEWLKTYFIVEPIDEEVLSKPETYIINNGGHIFFALLNNEVVGTVALMPKETTFELTKMAVSPKHRGHKIGQQLMEHTINFAKNELQLNNLILYSNRILKNAIHIYKKYGFIEIPVEKNSPYKRSNIKMQLDF